MDTGNVVVIDEEYILGGLQYQEGKSRIVDFRNDSWVIVYSGRRGGGKTTAMVSSIVRATALDPKVKIIANLPIEFYIRRKDGHLDHYVSQTLDWYKLLTFSDDYTDCVIGIDEAADQINCMAAQTLRNRLVDAFVRQLRKNNNNLLMCSQEFGLIDRAMRWQVDIVIDCQDMKKKHPDYALEKGEAIIMDFEDNSGNWTNMTTNQRLGYHQNPVVLSLPLYPRILWGEKGKTKPVFDTLFTIDPTDAFRKVDLRLSKLEIGEDAGEGVAVQYPVAGHLLHRVSQMLENMKDSGERVLQANFWQALGNVPIRDKQNLAKLLSQFGLGRDNDDPRKRLYEADDFRLSEFREYVQQVAGEAA